MFFAPCEHCLPQMIAEKPQLQRAAAAPTRASASPTPSRANETGEGLSLLRHV